MKRTNKEQAVETAKGVTPETKRAQNIEMAKWTIEFSEKDGREQLAAALDHLRRKVAEIERELARPENDLPKALYQVRHNLAWAYANIESNLSVADTRALELATAKATMAALAE